MADGGDTEERTAEAEVSPRSFGCVTENENEVELDGVEDQGGDEELTGDEKRTTHHWLVCAGEPLNEYCRGPHQAKSGDCSGLGEDHGEEGDGAALEEEPNPPNEGLEQEKDGRGKSRSGLTNTAKRWRGQRKRAGVEGAGWKRL